MANNNKDKVLNAPPLRFPEFSGEWEKMTLDSCLERLTNGITYDANNKQGYPVSRIETITNKQINYNKVGFYNGKIERLAPYKMQKGDILFSHINSLPHMGKTAFYDGEQTLYHGMNLLLLRGNSLVDKKFLYYALNVPRILYRFQVIAKQAVNQASISTGDLKKEQLSLCGITEQKKIASFLTLLDKRIATQIGLIEDLKRLKSAIMDDFFGGRTGTVIRLGDVGTYIRGLTYNSDDVCEDNNGTVVVRANNIVDGEEISLTNEIVKVRKHVPFEMMLKDGDIAVCMANGSTRLIGKNSFYKSHSENPITVGAFCGIFRSSLVYTRWLMQTKRYRRYVYQSLQGGNGAIANLNGIDILNMKFFVPKEVNSCGIIPLLESIETKIQIGQRMLDLYEMQKQYLLRNMFI